MDRYVDLTVKYNKGNIHFSWNIYAHITACFIVALWYFKFGFFPHICVCNHNWSLYLLCMTFQQMYVMFLSFFFSVSWDFNLLSLYLWDFGRSYLSYNELEFFLLGDEVANKSQLSLQLQSVSINKTGQYHMYQPCIFRL